MARLNTDGRKPVWVRPTPGTTRFEHAQKLIANARHELPVLPDAHVCEAAAAASSGRTPLISLA